MNRRDFVKQLSAGMGAALSPGVLAAILSGCQAEPEASGLLSNRELNVIAGLSEAIIPTTDTPGAIAAGVPRYVEMMMEHFTPADEVEVFRAQLDWVANWLAGQDANGLDDIAEDTRNAFLAALDEEAFGGGTASETPPGEPALFAVLKPLTVAGYYTSEVGALQELHQPPMGLYKGDIPLDEIGKTWA